MKAFVIKSLSPLLIIALMTSIVMTESLRIENKNGKEKGLFKYSNWASSRGRLFGHPIYILGKDKVYCRVINFVLLSSQFTVYFFSRALATFWNLTLILLNKTLSNKGIWILSEYVAVSYQGERERIHTFIL